MAVSATLCGPADDLRHQRESVLLPALTSSLSRPRHVPSLDNTGEILYHTLMLKVESWDCTDTPWVGQVPPWDHHLDRFQPLWASAGVFLAPTPLAAHTHRTLEIGLVLTGGKEVHYGDAVVAAGAGDVWLCSIWEPHAWRVAEPQTAGVVMVFVPEMVEEIAGPELPWLSMFTASPSRRPRVTSAAARRQVKAIGSDLYREINQQAAGWSVAVRMNLVRLLIALHREWTPDSADAAHATEQANHLTRVIPALTLVNSRPGRRVTWREAARVCNLSPSRFNSLFRQALGLTFERFCLQSRLHYAAHLLLSTDLPVEAIADQTEFADASHLHRTFRKHYGCRPGEYRRWRGRAHTVLVPVP